MIQLRKLVRVGLVLGASYSAALAGDAAGPDPVPEVERVLDDWHQAASVADEGRYLGHLDTDAVFLGTADGERWTVEEFREFVHPYFSAGRGWTYVPVDRHVAVSADGKLAWFDEKLDSEKYGRVRGSGVLRNARGTWKLVHYNMSFPIPNEVALEVVALIRERASKSP